MKKVIIILTALMVNYTSGIDRLNFEKISEKLKNKYNIHSVEDLNKLKSINKSRNSNGTDSREMSDFIGEWSLVNQEMGMSITVGTDQAMPDINSIMAFDSAEGRITVIHDNFETELNYIMLGDMMDDMNSSISSNNTRDFGAFNFAQSYVDDYSVNWGEEPFDIEERFNLVIEDTIVSGGLGGDNPDNCEINWPEDPYHIAVYSFVSEYVLYEGGSVGCFTEDFSLDQTYADVALEMEQMWTGDDGGGGDDDGDADIIFMNFDFWTYFGIMFGMMPDSIENPMILAVDFEEELVFAQLFESMQMFSGIITEENFMLDIGNGPFDWSFSFSECNLTDSLGNQELNLNGTIAPAMIELLAGVETEIPSLSFFDDFEEVPEQYISFYNDSTGREITIDEYSDYYGDYYTEIDTTYFEWYATSDSVFLNIDEDDYYYDDSSDGFEGVSYSFFEDTMTVMQEQDPCSGENDYYYDSYDDCIDQYVMGVTDVESFQQWFYTDFIYEGTVSISESKTIIPHAMKLYPAYPNPFNPIATIQFDIAKNYQSNTLLNIYDISGRIVAELINEKYDFGSYSATWDASSFASGVYFTELISGNQRETQKIILLK
jgi:hypothetical protein